MRSPRPGDQSSPLPARGPDVQSLVIADLQQRHKIGVERYGTGLKAFNGRSGLRDLYEELMDAIMYVRQVMEEDRELLIDENLEFRSDMTVQLVQSMAMDASVVLAARVSTQAELSHKALELNGTGKLQPGSPEDGLIRFLMKARHGSPFEHNFMTFLIQAPIFVFREMMRHRIGCSYNEESGRYRELRPVFYLPADNRPLMQVGKAGKYEFEAGTSDQWELTQTAGRRSARIAYAAYKQQLEAGIAREVARMVLPLSIYSSVYVTMNARSLMNFLSLRTKRDHATFPSFPQREIEMVAEDMETLWSELMPVTHAAFQGNGRVAP